MVNPKKIAELFEKGRSTITEHLKNIFLENELDEDSVCLDFRQTAEDGKTYNITMGMINHEIHEKHEKSKISNFSVFRGSKKVCYD